jgi:GTPase
LASEAKADFIIINDFLKPAQSKNLNLLFYNKQSHSYNVTVWDRTDIILKIFEKHAKSEEAKLEIKLAILKHQIPKAYQYEAKLFDRERGGISGTRGAGEAGIEQEKRHIRNQIKEVEKKLEKIQKSNAGRRKNRRRNGLKTIALVGYTNAGKSTLLRALTQKETYIANKLFATLDTRIGSLWLPNSAPVEGIHSVGQKVLIADTIGFIQNLPPHLIESFTTTLSEVQEADLIIHVIDSSDSEVDHKIQVVEDVLADLKITEIPIIKVYNKTDQSPTRQHKGIKISALKKEGLKELKKEVEYYINKKY